MIFSILKIIGLILLVILCFILFLILLVLLVPVRYAAEFEYDSEHMRLDVKVTWLVIVRFYAKLLNKDFSYRLKVLFFRIMDSTAVKTKTEQKETYETPCEPQSGEQIPESPVTKETVTETVEQVNHVETPQESSVQNEEEPEDGTQESKSRKKFSFHIPFRLMHPADIYDKIIRAFMDLSRKLDKICAQIVSEENRETVLFVLEQIKKLCRHICPRKHGIYLKVGMKDPSHTGQIFLAYTVINRVWGLNFILEPDFDHEVLETKLYLKGRIRVINLLIIVIRLYSNKTLRKLIRRK